MKQMIGNMIRYHRKQSGLSQKDLADLAEVGKTVVYDIEKGKSNFRIDTFLRITNVLNIRIDFNSQLMDYWRRQYEKTYSEDAQ